MKIIRISLLLISLSLLSFKAYSQEQPIQEQVFPEDSFQDIPKDETMAWRFYTNLLYWAALAHNAGVEYSFDDHNYLSLSSGCAWWRKLDRNWAYRWLVGELAYMYVIKPDKRNLGLQAGTYIQGGMFEFMNGPKNRQGEFISGGLSIAYRWRIKGNSVLHAELGLGYMYIDYRFAVPMEGKLIYQGSDHMNYWGPTRASLSYILYLKKK